MTRESGETLAPLPELCADHHPLALGYSAWHEEAERRGKNGMKQRRCPDCQRWLWHDERGSHPGWRTWEKAVDD